tara:strand:+ start:3361 stop:3504 length:144 start_codon:yes stop_codon:yes gene_type:complete
MVENDRERKMKIVLFGCKDTSLHFAKRLFEVGYEITLVTISYKLGKK